ncbi:MAG: pilin [Candidatus Moraniibacteriota bacterium]
MKKIKQALYAAVATALAAAPLMAGAASTPQGFNVPNNGTGGLVNMSVYDLVTRVMNWLLGLIGVLAVIAFVISGILYLTAAGDEDQVEKAKSIMMYAIIGLVVALIGLIVVNAIAGLTGGTGGTAY